MCDTDIHYCYYNYVCKKNIISLFTKTKSFFHKSFNHAKLEVGGKALSH